jgi:prevent-host-death family protein
MATVNIYEAKTQFSKLVKRVRAGQEIIIADAGKPVAKLVPIEPPKGPRVLGQYRDKIWISADAFDPMTPQELAEWENAPIFPPTVLGPGPKRGNVKSSPTKGPKLPPRGSSRRGTRR